VFAVELIHLVDFSAVLLEIFWAPRTPGKYLPPRWLVGQSRLSINAPDACVLFRVDLSVQRAQFTDVISHLARSLFERIHELAFEITLVADFFAKHHSFNENALLEGNLGAGAKTDGHLWVTHPAETTGRGKVEFG